MSVYNCNVASSFISQIMFDRINVEVYLDDGNCLFGTIDYYEESSNTFVLNGNKLIMLAKIRRIEPDLDHRDWKFKPPVVIGTSDFKDVASTAYQEGNLKHDNTMIMLQRTLSTLLRYKTTFSVTALGNTFETHVLVIDPIFSAVELYSTLECGCRLHFMDIDSITVHGTIIYNKEI